MMSDERNDLFDRIGELEVHLRNAEAVLAKKTSERKLARETVEDLVAELRKLTGELVFPTPMPLFDEDDQDEEIEQPTEPVPTDAPDILAPAVDHDAWRSILVAEIPELPPEVVKAMKADGVTTAGEWVARQVSGDELPAYDKLDWLKFRQSAEETLDRAVEDRLPRCRICGCWDREFYDRKPGEVASMWVEGETPLLCDQCEQLKDGPPDFEAIAPERHDPSQTWMLPECLRKAPLKDPAKQLGRLKDAFDEEAGRESGAGVRYKSLIATWPQPPADFAGRVGDDEQSILARYISHVQVELEHVAAARGRKEAIQEAIDKVQVVVDQAAAAKAAKANGKKSQPATTASITKE
jgi:hypothetical protein